jgi:enoyl-CoA hydratase
MTSGLVKVGTPRPHVCVVELDRPPVNALARPLREELVATFDALGDRDDVRAIVLTARGRVFCAGADIKEKDALGGTEGDHQRANRLTRDAFFSVLDSPKPVIAAVNGAALGAGCVLAACCDVVFAAEDAFFAMPEIDVGLGGGASFLQRFLPPPAVRRMVLTGERVPAAELHRLGAIERPLPADELVPAAVELAAALAAKSPLAVRTIRSSFGAVESLSLRDGFRLEQEYTTALSRSADAEEARRAFLEKRDPSF